MREERSALFVRLPVSQSRRLDAAARSAGRTKQEYVAAALEVSLGESTPSRREASPLPGPPAASERDEVLTLQELAHLLKAAEGEVMARVAAGDLPGRRFGKEWRFSRTAVLQWLDGSDADRPQYGFGSPHPVNGPGRRGNGARTRA